MEHFDVTSGDLFHLQFAMSMHITKVSNTDKLLCTDCTFEFRR